MLWNSFCLLVIEFAHMFALWFLFSKHTLVVFLSVAIHILAVFLTHLISTNIPYQYHHILLQDTIHAVRSLVTQSSTHDTVLRRGLLTSTLQQPVELVTTRRLPHRNHIDQLQKQSSKWSHPSTLNVSPIDAPLFGSISAWICAYGSEIFYVIYMMARYNWIFLCLMVILVSIGLVWLRQNVGHKHIGHRPNAHGRL